MKIIHPNQFKVTAPVQLTDQPTTFDLDPYENNIEVAIQKIREKLSKLQDTMYAHNRYGVLICLQGMDTAGKDSLIREVFKEINARGVVVHSFKTPSTNELEHDYIWRHYLALPEKGKFSVFNRTHYENVLITRVHPEYILHENLPGIKTIADITPEFWDHRFESINDFEKHITRNGVIVLKFFLHLSKEEQRHRLIRRLETTKHNWKFSPSDLKERALWDSYQSCYEAAINKTSKPHAPWYIVPADHKETARYIVAKTILDELQTFTDIKESELDEKIKANIVMYREQLKKEI